MTPMGRWLVWLAVAGCGAPPPGAEVVLDASVVVVDLPTATDSSDAAVAVDVQSVDAGTVYLAPGAIALTWTVDSEPAATGCPAGSVVTIELGFGAPVSVPCSAGAYTSQEPASHYGFTLTLISGSDVVDTVQQTASIGPNVTTMVSVNFSTTDR